jgi:hypothetical protein
MIREILRTLFFQKVLDHLLSVALIMLLTMLAILSLDVIRPITEVCARVASHSDLRLDIHYTYALTGEWPRDSSTLLRTRPIAVPYSSFAGDQAMLEDGAINIRPTRGRIAGETISLRPAVQADNVLGPISWVAGSGSADPERLILGDDATTIDPHWIPHDMR